MSAKLYKCVAAKKLVIARRAGVTGEVALRFKNPNIKQVIINSNQPIDLFTNFKNVSQDDVLNSNMLELIASGVLTIVN
jgi:hypothetical protein